MLLALHGRLQAGKDTTFERIKYLASQLPEHTIPGVPGKTFPEFSEVTRIAFADPLKNSAAALLKVSREELEWMKVSEIPTVTVRVPLSGNPDDYRFRTVSLTGREYLQLYGTEAHRDIFGDSFWVDQAMEQANRGGNRSLFVITDCRFPNEAQAVKQRGDGYVVHVVGPEGKAAGGHSSEQVLDDDLIDFEIDNSVRGDDFANLDYEIKNNIPALDPATYQASTYS
jgi:hypothetical protein